MPKKMRKTILNSSKDKSNKKPEFEVRFHSTIDFLFLLFFVGNHLSIWYSIQRCTQ